MKFVDRSWPEPTLAQREAQTRAPPQFVEPFEHRYGPPGAGLQGAKWTSSLRNGIDNMSNFGTYRAPATLKKDWRIILQSQN
jgi:hypothetical protein